MNMKLKKVVSLNSKQDSISLTIQKKPIAVTSFTINGKADVRYGHIDIASKLIIFGTRDEWMEILNKNEPNYIPFMAKLITLPSKLQLWPNSLYNTKIYQDQNKDHLTALETAFTNYGQQDSLRSENTSKRTPQFNATLNFSVVKTKRGPLLPNPSITAY